MYNIDLDTAASEIKALRKAVKGVQVMCGFPSLPHDGMSSK